MRSRASGVARPESIVSACRRVGVVPRDAVARAAWWTRSRLSGVAGPSDVTSATLPRHGRERVFFGSSTPVARERNPTAHGQERCPFGSSTAVGRERNPYRAKGEQNVFWTCTPVAAPPNPERRAAKRWEPPNWPHRECKIANACIVS